MAGLKEYPVAAVLRAENLSRARDFYTQVLGLEPIGDESSQGDVMLEAGDGSLLDVYERPGMAAPENTTLVFGVPKDHFDETVAELRSKGVMFEEYDVPEMQIRTVNGVGEMDGERMAWFKDTEGNIISIGTM